MKKVYRYRSKKAFTLVELIVVLVILAVLAAMLVPALTGYIRKARNEKDLQLAYDLKTAAQSVLDEMYGRGENPAIDHNNVDLSATNTGSFTWNWNYWERVEELAGIPKNSFRNNNLVPYVFMIECGRCNKYMESEDYRCYTIYRTYFQATPDSDMYIIDNTGVHNASDRSYTSSFIWGSNADVDTDGDGVRDVATVVYGVGGSTPNSILSNIRNGNYH